MDTKQCSRCKETKPFDSFGSNKRTLDKLQQRCRECTRIDQVERKLRWTPEQKERDKGRNRNRSRVNEKKRIHKRDNRTPEQKREASRIRTVRNYERMNAYKLEVGCVDCGYKGHFAALEFDHLPGHTRLNTVSSLTANRSWKTLLKEVAKCELVCANCHNIRTYNRRKGIEPATGTEE